ncbi:sister chromatid cohesion 1 protein 3-like [Nicotiana tomentosiformis]|uniref:sister chromatid cohesion 1 protein 3-like n=1 Tax=Nicotiana tomentosiformis TaxID=4098 RepID=UPI00051B6719|nr:sister chromatid cohesion 1 protein 3-like [Nicotiana tomentosiformis]XP_016467261.1 PREDICTED: sister chromatid cohesion 1 protein 3-like [Nicotiana tabacum]
MFYSHTFLGRKGPLGTVWCAAHLQKLKKPHYTSTHIPSTVERIMYPDVPIALRMSGHLLFGVVRIYSKQVEYFSDDCKNLQAVLFKAFSSTNVNLPADATHAPYHSITLPETFELDALVFDEDFDLNRFEDTHLKSYEEITLEDQILTREDQYVAILIDEDIAKSLSKSGEVSGSGAMPMETDSDPSNPDGTAAQSLNSSPKNQSGLNRETVHNDIPQDIPEIEIMRDAVRDHSFDHVPLWSDQGNDVMEPDKILEEQIMRDKETTSPIVEEMGGPEGHSIPSQQQQEPPSATSVDAHEFADPQMSFGHQSPDIALRSTPPPEMPKSRGRKRKLLKYDKELVLSNKKMRRDLEDTGDLVRQKNKAPFSCLDIWKQNNRLRKDGILFEPLITGLCDDLCNIYKEDFISAKVKTASPQEDHAEPSYNQSPTSGNDLPMEIERLRDNQGFESTDLLSEILPSPNKFISSPLMSMPSTSRRDDFTPATTTFGTESSQMERTTESEVLPTPDPAAFTGYVGSDMETPSTWYGEGLGVETTVLSDIPEFDNSAGDLSFLEQDDNTPIGLRGTPSSSKQGGTPEFDTLSARTRAVAQYLKGQSPATPILEDTGDLSLNAILEGKKKTICARMFYETLVLENCGLVHANQNEPYGDITLKVTSKLKEQFSS